MEDKKVETPYDALTYKIIGIAMAVHREIGPGFPEEVYRRAMLLAAHDEELTANQEVAVAVEFCGQSVGEFRLDLVFEHQVVIELKAVDALHPVHERQVISYLAASGLPVGLLINFGATSLQHHRIFPPTAVQSSSAFNSRQTRWNK